MNRVAYAHPKLTRRLWLALLITFSAVLVLATITAGLTAYFEVSDTRDETLLSVANLVETNQVGAVTDDDVFDADDFDDSAIRVWEPGQESRGGLRKARSLKQGFHTVHERGDFWRVYITRENRLDKRFIVAQKLSASTELALNSATNTAVPLLFLFLIVPLLVTWIVRHSFKPLNALANEVQASDSLQLGFAAHQQIPVELVPFVSAIEDLLEKNVMHNEQQRRFIADAAHELRTPIAALSLQIENVQSSSNETVRSERQATLATSIRRLQRLVNQLLDLARVQSTQERDEVKVSLNEVIKTQISELYPLVDEKNISLTVPRNVAVSVNDSRHQLQHLVRNAISNAIKYAPREGAVEVEVFEEHGKAVLQVSDNGPGVADDLLEKLHQPFYRPEGQTKGQGAGLGLAICHEIASLLHGRLTLHNHEPHGFVFRFSMPRATD